MIKNILTWLGIQLIRCGLLETSKLLKDLEYKGKGEYVYKKKVNYTENEM